MVLTEWYPSNIKPVRKGVYITRKKGLLFFQYWNGRFWTIHQQVQWKGIKR